MVTISQEDARACLSVAAEDLKKLSYDELGRFAVAHRMLDDWQSRELQINGERVWLNTMITKLGRVRKRIGVEMTLSAEGELLPPDTPFLYFERYKSGRFYPSPLEEQREARVVQAMPYMLIAGLAIVLLVGILYLYARSG